MNQKKTKENLRKEKELNSKKANANNGTQNKVMEFNVTE